MQDDSHAMLDYFVERGGNLIDTAEMYPAPASDPRWKPGRSEEIVGSWIAKHPELRSKVLIATKVAGFSPSSETAGNRKLTLGTGGERGENGAPKPIPARLDKASIIEACNASLKRLQTNYIDLYQIHWPDRYCPIFGSLCYNPTKEREGSIPISEQVAAIKELIDAGKIRSWPPYLPPSPPEHIVWGWRGLAPCPRACPVQAHASMFVSPTKG